MCVYVYKFICDTREENVMEPIKHRCNQATMQNTRGPKLWDHRPILFIILNRVTHCLTGQYIPSQSHNLFETIVKRNNPPKQIYKFYKIMIINIEIIFYQKKIEKVI